MQLTIRNLFKTYQNGTAALSDLSMTINSGLFGLLGPNGAGKSTLMRTLATLQSADSGEIFLNDINVLTEKQKVRDTLGYLPQDFGVFPNVSAMNMLDYYAMLKGINIKAERKEWVENLLHMVNLYEHRKNRVDKFSGGMKQRFGIAQALLGDPKLIIVDEPTAGLDPAERVRFNNLLSEISAEKVIILSTHIVEDVSDLCSDMAMINQGKLLLQGPPEKVINSLQGRVWRKKIAREELIHYQQNHHVISSRLKGGQPVIHILSDNSPGTGFSSSVAELEDVYFSQIGKSL